MKRSLLILLSALWMFSLNAQSLSTNYASNFDVHWYGIHLEVDPAIRFIKGHVQSTFRMKEADHKITWNFTNALIVDSILFDQQKIAFQQNEANKLQVNLPMKVQKDQLASMDIFYHGVPPKQKIADNDSGYSFIATKHKGQPVLFTVNEPYGAMQWWPNKNTLDDKADSVDFFISHPSGYKVSANGLLISETKHGDQVQTHFKHRYPVASYLIAFAVANYVVFEKTAKIGNKKVPIITYAYPETVKRFEKNADALVTAIELYSKVFGDYPFANECYMQTQVSGAGGMEHQGNSFVDGSNISLQNHELVHQWFGNKITHNNWSAIWLKEGAAVYFSDYLYPKLTAEKDSSSYLLKEWLAFITSETNGQVWVNENERSKIERLFDGRLTYVKSAFVYRMLQGTLGDSLFFEGLKHFLNDPKLAYGFASANDLQRHLETVSNRTLSYFFDQWVYGEGHPSFSLQWNQDKKGKLQLVLNQQSSHASVKIFSVPLPILLKGKDKQKMITIDFDRNNTTININDVGFSVTQIIIDPEQWFITKNNRVQKNSQLNTIK
jgi:aminopeptidase N